MLPHEEPLLTDQQLRDASLEQLEDLVQRINLSLQERGMPGLVWRQTPEDGPKASDPADPGGSLAPDHRYPPATGGEPSPASGKGLWGNRSWTPHLGGVYIYAMNPQ